MYRHIFNLWDKLHQIIYALKMCCYITITYVLYHAFLIVVLTFITVVRTVTYVPYKYWTDTFESLFLSFLWVSCFSWLVPISFTLFCLFMHSLFLSSLFYYVLSYHWLGKNIIILVLVMILWSRIIIICSRFVSPLILVIVLFILVVSLFLVSLGSLIRPE